MSNKGHKFCVVFGTKNYYDMFKGYLYKYSKADWNNFMNSAEAEYKNKYSETATTEPTAEKVAV